MIGIGNGNHMLFFISRDGLGWRVGGSWYRLRPPGFPLLFSERYGNGVIWRFMGWRISKRRTGRPWHGDFRAQPPNDGEPEH